MPASGRPVVCVQGLGFVGAAMAAAVAAARTPEGEPHFDVVGVDLPTPDGRAKVDALNGARPPMASTDEKMARAVADAHEHGNLVATADDRAYELAAVTIVNVPLDVVHEGGRPTVRFDGFRAAVRILGERMPPGSLVVVETTVPPGTCERVAAPELAAALERRGLPADTLLLAHSGERVMPGNAYFDSIVRFWKCYAGHTAEAADACAAFLSKVIDVEAFPLTRLHSTTASETAKVLENSYRAVTIAFMEEWGRFAETVGVDLFEVIGAVRKRPTHSNMRQPGFGVGGYCLTKDPLLAGIGAREIFGHGELAFPFSAQAIEVNGAMPLVSVERVQAMLGGGLAGKRLLLLGVSYRQDVADTRYSPSEIFVRSASGRGADVACHDPLVSHWAELGVDVATELPAPDGLDALVFAVPHRMYRELELESWLGGARPAVLDANDVLSREQRRRLRDLGCAVESIGRGAGL